MKKILFIAAHRPNRSPSQRFRFEQYFGFLEENGFQCDLRYILNEKDDRDFYARGKILRKAGIVWNSYRQRRKDVVLAREYDIIFIQREAFMLGGIQFEKRLSRLPAKLIFDFDDAIWKMDISEGNAAFKRLKNPDKTSRLITLADYVIAGNRYLADYAQQFNKNITIIPTTVDTGLFTPAAHKEHTEKPVTIGWSGSITTVKHFELLIPVLQRLKEKYGAGIRFSVSGDSTYRNDALGITGKAWSSAQEIEDLRGFDIGVMPLPDDEWSRGKCGLKGLTYMALEIPAVMSAVGVNTEIIQSGVNGFLAATTDEWETHLSALVENPGLRGKLGKAGRQTVIDRYSVTANQHLYLNLFNACINS